MIFNSDSFSVIASHTIGVSTPVYAVSRAGARGEGGGKDAAAYISFSLGVHAGGPLRLSSCTVLVGVGVGVVSKVRMLPFSAPRVVGESSSPPLLHT